MTEWISVKDKLPENGAVVAVIINAKSSSNLTLINDVMIAQYWDNGGEYDDHWDLDEYTGFYDPEVSYWIPLPDPPEKD